ncbi:peroxisomal membrane protein 11C isoform X1 [Carettochelys insculpta]
MSVTRHENRKSCSSSGSMNIQLFHKPGHADSLLTQLNLLRKRCLFTDVVLRAGSQAFPCHRAVLASCSRYFDAMFSGGLKESRDTEVNFHDSLHPEVLELLLDYTYSARVLINEENAESLLEAGDMLQFQDLRDAAADFLEKNLHPANCLNMLLLADAHCCKRLRELAWRMALAHFAALCQTEDFLRLPKDELLELVESEELEVEDESLVYEAVLGWIRYDLPQRHEDLPQLLRSVRLALLPESYLRNQVATEELVTSHKLGGEIVANAVRCKMKLLQNDGLVTGLCAQPRKVSQALLLLGGQTFVCDKIYMVDRQTSQIIPHTDIPSPRKECSACALGCRVYVTGGKGSTNGASKDVWVYDTLHDEWAKAAPMLVARFGHGSAELDQCLYVVGGHTAASSSFPASPSVSLKQVELYDPHSDKWSLVAPLREGVSNAAVVGTKRKLFVFGGTSVSQEKLPKVQCFDTAQNRWTTPASCPQPWRYTAAAVMGNHVIVIGGDTEFSASSAYRFHSDTYQWSKFGDVTTKRISCRAVTTGNRLYVVGGYCGAQRCKTLDCYDPSSDTWSSVSTVPYSLIPTAFVSTWTYLSA